MECPLCAADAGRLLGVLDLEQSLRAMGARLPVEVLAEPTDIATVRLFECADCGLHYFAPAAVGTSRLYEHLAEQHYYEPLRWDQRVALDTVVPGEHVVDLGCGSGSFVLAAADRGAHVVGVDFSASSFAGARGDVRFVRARADLAGDGLDRVRTETGQSDLVTAFQLVEHLEDPVGFLGQAATLIQPSGRLVISVPNRERFEVDPVQALDCPPHHQTRWAVRQLEMLGHRAGLVAETVRVERTTSPLRIANRLARRLVRPRTPKWPLPPAARPWPPSHLRNGMSLVATYRRRA